MVYYYPDNIPFEFYPGNITGRIYDRTDSVPYLHDL